MNMNAKNMHVVYDTKLCRPGCALLQAIKGGSPGVASLFPTESWLLAPTPDLKTYDTTQEQLHQLVAITTKTMMVKATRKGRPQ